MKLVHEYCFDIYVCKSLKSGQDKTLYWSLFFNKIPGSRPERPARDLFF